MRTIRDGKLYRETHDTFEDYLQKRWQIARATAYQMMDGSAVFERVCHGGHLENVAERHIRPLTKLDEEHQVAAWQKAIDMAPKTASSW